MRAKDFVKEASIFTKPRQYTFGHKVNAKPKLASAIQSEVPDYADDEELEWVAQAPSNSPQIQFGTGNTPRYFKRPNGSLITIIGTDKVIQSQLRHAKGQKGSTAANKGDLSEPVLSAAVVAKLIKRGASEVASITADDIKSVLMSSIQQGKTTYTVQDKNSKVADTIEFSIAGRGPTIELMKDPNFWDTLGFLPASSAHYANSGQLDRYADYFYLNGKADLIKVVSDGVSDQKGRKTDITAYVRGDDGSMRPLKNLSISLKAGSPHIGQVGGGDIKKPIGPRGIWTNANALFSPLGITISQPTEPIENKDLYWVSVYQEAAQQLQQLLAGQNAKKEAGIVSKIVDFISYQATKGDPTVRLVSLNKGGLSSVHSFKNLYDKLLANNIDLTTVLHVGKSRYSADPRPSLKIFDKNGKGELLSIRYSSTEAGDKIWNTIEMQPLLKNLTTLISKPKNQSVNPPANFAGTRPAKIAGQINNTTRLQKSKIPMGQNTTPTV